MNPAEVEFLAAWVRDTANPHNPDDCRALRLVEDLKDATPPGVGGFGPDGPSMEMPNNANR